MPAALDWTRLSREPLFATQTSRLHPVSPTTKECNSRLHKHFGSLKWRCYNRLTASYFRLSSGFPSLQATGSGELLNEPLARRHGTEQHRSENDNLVRIIE